MRSLPPSRSAAADQRGGWLPAWRRLWRVPGDERWLVLQVLMPVPALAVGLRWFGLRKLYGMRGGQHPAPSPRPNDIASTPDGPASTARR